MQGLLDNLALFRKDLNAIKQHKELYILLSYDIKITKKLLFWRENVKILSLCAKGLFNCWHYSAACFNDKNIIL